MTALFGASVDGGTTDQSESENSLPLWDFQPARILPHADCGSKIPRQYNPIFVMVQGKTKGLKTKGPNSRAAAKAAANPKKGKKIIAPKKLTLVKQQSQIRVCKVQP